MINQEPEIKAGVVAILGRLWTWPPSAAPAAGAPLRIGVLGNDPFRQGNVNFLDEKTAGKNVVVARFATVDDYEPCHILVVSEAADLPSALKKTQGQHVLVVSQAPGLAEKGAMLNLVVRQNRVRMEINLANSKRAGLKPHPGVLRMPMVDVIGQPPPNPST